MWEPFCGYMLIIMNTEIHNNLEEAKIFLDTINTPDAIQFSEWTKEKTYLRYNGKLPQFPIYNNFIYWCNLGVNIGSEQNKLRPVLILRSSKNSPICTILPLTTKRLNDELWFHVDLEKIDSTVLVEQLKVVSKIRITDPFRRKGKLHYNLYQIIVNIMHICFILKLEV